MTTLVAALAAAGFSLRVRNGKLLVSPYSLLTAEQREQIKAHRDELLAALSEPAGGPIPPVGEVLDADTLASLKAAEAARVSPAPLGLADADLERLPIDLCRAYQHARAMEGWRPCVLVWSQQSETIRNIWRRLASVVDGRPRVGKEVCHASD